MMLLKAIPMSNGSRDGRPDARWLSDRLPLAYLVACVPFGLVYCFLVPPMLVPDEWAHYFRTVQIAYGDAIGEKPEGKNPGGQVPQSLTTFLDDPRFTKWIRSKKPVRTRTESQESPAEISRLRFDDETTFHTCPFVQYPPSSYLFGACAVRLGRAWRLDAVSLFYLARFSTFVPSVLMGWLALRWMSSGRLFAFCLLSVPTVLSLFGSCSQDAALIAFTALSVGFIQRFLGTAEVVGHAAPRGTPFTGAVITSAAVGAVAAGRPPYLPLIGLVPLFFLATTHRWRQAAMLAGVGIAVPACWLWITRDLGSGNEFGSDHAGQVQFILTHPWQFVAVFFRSVWSYVSTSSYLRHIVAERPNGGPLAPWIYHAAWIMLVVAVARDARMTSNNATAATRILSLTLLCGAFFALHLAGYIYFTPVGGDRINGIQGRYLVPLMLALPLVIGRPASAGDGPMPGTWAGTGDLAVVAAGIGIAVAINLASTINIMRNFYYP